MYARRAGLPDGTTYQNENIYTPNDHKMYVMARKYTKWAYEYQMAIKIPNFPF
jgi:hypothetical protein